MNRVARVSAYIAGAACALGALFAAVHQQSAQGPSGGECRLTVPGSSIDPMVFPTKDGSEALDAAIVGNADDSVVTRVISERGGFTIAHGTSCSELEAGPMYTRVLVTEGKFVGKTVWTPSIHTHGK
jgi:hypothetical protein